MTRINSNVESLVALNNLSRTNQALNQTLTKLSTGQRINRGADDPAGLIASETLSRELAALEAETRSVERNRSAAYTADAALADVSGRLVEARGLAVQAANTGAMSDAEREAIELEYQSIEQSVDRTLQSASFAGRKLFDGSVTLSAGSSLSTSEYDGGRLSLPMLNERAVGDVGEGGTGRTLADTQRGESADPFADRTRAEGVAVLDASIDQINTLRGEIGSFTRNAMESSLADFRSAFENVSAARSVIRDADYAALSTELSRNETLGAATIGSLLAGNANREGTFAALSA